MIERDYLMRMINILTRMLARILLLKDKREFPKALADIQTTSKMLLGIDQDLLGRLSTSQIMQLFGSDLTVAVPKSYVVAVLFKAEADVRTLMAEQDEPAHLYIRSLTLLLDTLEWANEPIEPDHLQTIEEVLESTRTLSFPAELLEKLLRYHERVGRYDKAENALYEILDVNPGFTAEGERFYGRMLEKTDEELTRGRLPREEIFQGIEEMRARKSG
jgi:tetratricopeptide (TPR) repeat protein